MIRHYLITAFRVIFRNKLYTSINLMGLALGLSCSTIILILVISEIRFDNFHENGDNIFLVQQTFDTGDGEYTTDRSGGAYGPALKNGFNEIEETIRFGNPGELLLSNSNSETSIPENKEKIEKKFIETNGLAADSGVFRVFSFPLIRGNPETALAQPSSMVVTENFTQKYFNEEDPIGKTIRINNKFDFTITGLIENVPENSSHKFDFLLPFDFLEELGQNIDWFSGNPFSTYVKLKNNSNWEEISRQLPSFFEELSDQDTETKQFLIPLRRVHLYGETKGIAGIILSSILAFLILMIACINFMNLSTARYMKRTMEVGIRKMVGATRWQLIKQFYGETLLLAFIALNISLILTDLMLDWMNAEMSGNIVLKLSDPVLILEMAGILIFTVIVAGSYPAIFLSGFKPIEVIRNIFKTGKKGARIRQILVVIQFTFSVILILLTWLVYKQYDYVKNADLGIERKDILFISTRGDLQENYSLFKEKLESNPDILSVSTASRIPLFIDQGEFEWGKEAEVKNDIAMVSWAGYDYTKLFDIQIVEGRFYSPKYETDGEESIVINQAMVKNLGWDSALGKTFYLYDDKYTVIGVVSDFYFFPLSLAGDGLILPFGEVSDYIFIRTMPGKSSGIIDFVEEVHESFNPAFPFIYNYLDDYMDPVYSNSSTISPIILGFTLLGIFISCLGLFGLSNFTTEQRTKEIGIRKTMGSSVNQIVKLLAFENIKLILISFMIAFPLGYLLIKFILKNLSYKTRVGPGIFLGTAGLVLIIVIITIGFQTYRSALRNPADSLRYE